MSDGTGTWPPTRDDMERIFREDAEAFAAIEPLIPPCPSWCTEEHKRHTDDGGIGRGEHGTHYTEFHRRGVVDLEHRGGSDEDHHMVIGLQLEQMEHTRLDGTVDRFPPALVLANADGVDLSAATCMSLTAALLAGVEELTMLAADVPLSVCDVPWCTDPHDDQFTSTLIDDPSVRVDIHSVKVSDDVAVCQSERHYPDGRTELEPPYVATYIDELGSDPDVIAKHGIAIARAAAKLREISA